MLLSSLLECVMWSSELQVWNLSLILDMLFTFPNAVLVQQTWLRELQDSIFISLLESYCSCIAWDWIFVILSVCLLGNCYSKVTHLLKITWIKYWWAPKEKLINRICFSDWSNVFVVNHYVFKWKDEDLIVFSLLKGQKVVYKCIP